MKFIDKTIEWISPEWGLKRAIARERFRSFDAATLGRRGKSMEQSRNTGPNLEISQALTILRSRSRGFVRNNGWAKRAIQAISNNTVGEGIRPAPIGTKNQVRKVKTIWKAWAESTQCDWYEKNTFYGLQKLAMKEIAEGGEVLIIKRRVQPTKANPIPIKLQLLEGDQLDHTRDTTSDEQGGYCRLGVKYDKEGRLLGYYVFDNHPTDGGGFFTKLQSTFIEKSECLHAFEILRIGQVRGIPMGIAAFLKMSDFSDYEDAQLIRQKVAACFTAFVTGDEIANPSDPLERVEPGIIQYLKSGETVSFGNPPPADGYDPYTTRILQGIAVAYGITYEMISGDYSKVNFSSGRMAQLNVIDNFKEWQYNMLVPQICVPAWSWFMDAAVMAGLISGKLECSCTDWTAPRIKQLDPVKETTARILQIQSGLNTISECLREDGRDPEEFFEEYKSDMDRLKELGITVSSIILPQIIEPNNNNNASN